MKKVSLAILCAVLAACGGGGGGGGGTKPAAPAPQPQPQPQPASTLTLSGTSLRTVAGGTPVALTAALSTNGTVRWKLADGAPGTLSTDTGTTVTYTPPASGLAAPAYVPVTATGDGASATLTLAVAPNPGVPRLAILAGHPDPIGTDGNGIEASFPNAKWLAADGAGNLYVLQHYTSRPSLPTPAVLRKIAPNGDVTTLVGSDKWFGAPDKDRNADRLSYPSGFAADREGNLYVSTSVESSTPVTAAILKITPAGSVSVLAGSEKPASATIADGTGAAAAFARPAIAGIDPDGNLYVRDANDTPRKITPAGVVTTLKAFPAGLNADMNGNTYRFDTVSRTLMRMTPDGSAVPLIGRINCENISEGGLGSACLGASVTDIIPLSGASFALLAAGRVVQLVVPQTTQAATPAVTLSSTTLRTIAGGAPVGLTASVTGGGGDVTWKLGDGAPGALSASSGTGVTYTPPAAVTAATLVPVFATRNGSTAKMTLAVTPDPGAPGLYLVAGNGQPSRQDGVGAQASFMFLKAMTTDLAGNIYVSETINDLQPRQAPGFVLRKITSDGTVRTLVGSDSNSPTYWFGRPDPGRYDLRTEYPNGLAVDNDGNLYLGQTAGYGGAGVLKITPAGTLSLLAGQNNDALPSAPVDGVGSAARFDEAYVIGIDYDNAIHVRDHPNFTRKVTLDGTVTTVPSVSPGTVSMNMDRDMSGNIYALGGDGTIVRVPPSGPNRVVAGTPGCTTMKLGALPGCLPQDIDHIVPYGGNALLLSNGRYIIKLVLPH